MPSIGNRELDLGLLPAARGCSVMVTLPFFLKVTTPFFTEATFLLEDFHFMPLVVPSGRVTLSACGTPTLAATVPDRLRVIEVGMVGSTTFRVSARFFLPILMVIFALPAFFGVSSPALETEATFFLEDL